MLPHKYRTTQYENGIRQQYSPPGWKLLGAFPDGEPDDVGSWILSRNDEAMLLEVPLGLEPFIVEDGLRGSRFKYMTVSHDHCDHYDQETWDIVRDCLGVGTKLLWPQMRKGKQGYDKLYNLGGEPLWIITAPKHSRTDAIVVFRGVAMTGDVELDTITSVNNEVSEESKKRSMDWYRGFQQRTGYRVHTVMSAHLNDFRTNVAWEELFTCKEPIGV